jgi:Mn2+/Fe2+ NRAMP family transporter
MVFFFVILFATAAGMHPAAVGPVVITSIPAKTEFGLYIIAGVLGG